MRPRVFLLKLGTIIWGGIFGLFMGLLVFGSILRMILHILFQWGDSGPEWVDWVIFLITSLTIIVSCYIFLIWTNSYLKKKDLI